MKRVGLVLLLAAMPLSAALAALPNPLADGLRKCSLETDQGKRLACFDALSASLPKVQQDQFGLTADIAHKREPAPSQVKEPEAPPPKPEVLVAKITAVGRGASGGLVFTLDNQQIWAQSQADDRFQFKVGEEVQIEHGAMGSLWLAAGKGRKTRVKRLS
jgi:hypothetical protein